ncbi:MAG: BamA/TamA family outer membrane protein [Bacteroidia bacterium]|nr:BamA/TamA family outer membrane protein [Bacteroidia bacterium]
MLRQSPFIDDNTVLGLKLFQYWRINPTFHFYLPLRGDNQSLAFRINTGIAKPFGDSETLPYEKFFFAGGGSSIRAWQPRRLGPGAFTPPVNEDGTFDYRFERPGEIILEGNIEYRFPMVSFIRGAVFLDVGNVWTIDENPQQPGGQFHWDQFWQQLAIGTGFGFRFNLPFLLFRLDFGLKVYDPARRSDRRWVIRQFNPFNPFAQDLMLVNIGIGYPF